MTPDLLLEPDLRSRVGRIVVLLDHWQDFFETAARDDGPSGDGGVYLLPGMSRHPSVVELARALESLWLYAPGCSAHLFGYYAAPFRVVRQNKREKNKHGKWRTIRGNPADPSMLTWDYARVRVLPSWVNPKRVEAGVRLVAQEPLCVAHRVGERAVGCPECLAVQVCRPWCFRFDPSVPAPITSRKGEVYDGEKGVAA